MDNCSGQKETDALSSEKCAICTETRFFHPNATHLIQPCDGFIIKEVKRAWTTHWETYKMGIIRSGMWKDSGRLVNTGKSFFLRFAAR